MPGLIAALVCALPVFADQVVLKNGDRLTGSIVRKDDKTLVFKSDLAGEVKIAWDSVAELKSAESVFVTLKSGEVLAGKVAVSAGTVEVQSKDKGESKTARENVTAVRAPKEQQAYEAEIERYRNPRLTDLWAGFVDLGFSQARGNSRTSTVSTSANASRATKRDKIGTYFTSLYASNSTGGASILTANAIRGGIKYERNLSPKFYTFVSSDMEFDQFQSLDLRFAPAGGLGGHIWKNGDKSYLDFQGGASLNREYFSTGLKRSSGEGLAGQEFGYQLSARTSVKQKFSMFSNLTRRGEYRMNFDATATTAIWKWLGWQFTVSDRLLSNPVFGRKKNDILLSTGIRITFAQ
ncbi:MAG: DUF481 domain-containing protein [Acidobacteria bacterium]|nr:DUF481 domain-containing protein [Acidobacteriota bacterium]